MLPGVLVSTSSTARQRLTQALDQGTSIARTAIPSSCRLHSSRQGALHLEEGGEKFSRNSKHIAFDTSSAIHRRASSARSSLPWPFADEALVVQHPEVPRYRLRSYPWHHPAKSRRGPESAASGQGSSADYALFRPKRVRGRVNALVQDVQEFCLADHRRTFPSPRCTASSNAERTCDPRAGSDVAGRLPLTCWAVSFSRQTIPYLRRLREPALFKRFLSWGK